MSDYWFRSVGKKSKTPKTTKGGKSPRGSTPRIALPTYAVDTATALTSYDSYSGAERISDIVYDINSENFRLWKAQATSDGLGTIDEITGWWVKDELTDDTYVTTNLVTTRSASTYGPGKFYVERMAWDLDPTTTQSLRNGSNVFAVNNLYATGVARAEGRAVSSGEFNDYRTLYASTYLPTDFPAGEILKGHLPPSKMALFTEEPTAPARKMKVGSGTMVEASSSEKAGISIPLEKISSKRFLAGKSLTVAEKRIGKNCFRAAEEVLRGGLVGAGRSWWLWVWLGRGRAEAIGIKHWDVRDLHNQCDWWHL